MEEKQIKHWLKENWFRSVIALGVLIISASAFCYFVVLSQQKEARIAEQAQLDSIEKSKKEAQIQEQAQLDLIEKNKLEAQKAAWNSLVNKCVTDAYTELKTLQSIADAVGKAFCIAALKSGNSCSDRLVFAEKQKRDDYETYINEWVPQCKLGNRVFRHYEPVPDNWPNN